MRVKTRIVYILAILSLILVVAAPPALAVKYSDIEGEFMCTCGCGKTMKNCDDAECSVKRNLRSTVQGLVDSGKSRTEIINVMRKNYGDTILAAPPKEGFNWAAYTTPFILVLAGALGIVLVVGSWVRQQHGPGNGEAANEPGAEEATVNKEYSDKLNKELKDIRWY